MEAEVMVLEVDWVKVEGRAVVRIWGKTKEGKSVLVFDESMLPYLYLEMNEEFDDEEGRGEFIERLKETEFDIAKIEVVERKMLGEKKKFVKVYPRDPHDVNKISNVVKNWKYVKERYEYGITFEKRYMIDKRIAPMEWIRVRGKELNDRQEEVEVSISAEKVERVEEEGILPKLKAMSFDIETYKDSVIMISVCTNEGLKKVITHGVSAGSNDFIEVVEDESTMIKRFVEIVKNENPDILLTYNGDVFDFPKIVEKATMLGVDMNLGRDGSNVTFLRRMRESSARIGGIVHVDLFRFVKNILSPSLPSEVLTLDAVSRHFLGMGKEEMSWRDIERLWKAGKEIERIASYSLKDSELTLLLWEKLKNNVFELSRIAGQNIFDVSRMSYSQIVEWLLCRKAFEAGEIILNRPKHDEIEMRRRQSPYMGGYVHEPVPGIHKNIAVFDFKGLYPSIIVTFNISPETLDKKGKRMVEVFEGEHFFNQDEPGFIPSIIHGLIKKREEIKKRMNTLDKDSEEYRVLESRQRALKIVANASYGYYAYPGARWYSRICAKSIAYLGRKFIKDVIRMAKERNMEVVYGDTDSLFIGNVEKNEAKEFLSYVNRKLPGIMELELEGIYTSGIFVYAKTGKTAKKRYALLDENGNVIVRGFEKVRRDWSNVAKVTQDTVISIILKESDVEKAKDYVRGVVEKIRRGEVKKDDLIIYTQITKSLMDYEQNAPHIAAARKYMSMGKSIKEGDVIGYIITKGRGSIAERAEPFERAENYDDEYYIYHQVLPAAMRILEMFGVREEDIVSGEREQKSLSSFWKK